jgi:hypothetical protein
VAGRRRIDPERGRGALASWRDGAAEGASVPRGVLADAVRYTLEEFAAIVPGNSVEIRVPPFGAVQAVAGPRHTRGTPPNVVQAAPDAWLALATGQMTWDDAVTSHRVEASGARATLAAYLPFA